jgi:purine-binding chemotaxis protein CheW
MNVDPQTQVAPSTAENTVKQICTFELDNYLFGIDVSVVQEVLRHQPMTPVPLTTNVIAGLINLRGQIVTTIDLRARLEFGPRTEDDKPMNVVISTDEAPVSLLVDRIGDVIDVTDVPFETPPETVVGVARDLILGAYKLENRLLLVLDIVRTIDLSNLTDQVTPH